MMKYGTSSFVTLLQAANYLNIKDLLDLTCKTVADMIRGKLTQTSAFSCPITCS